MISAKAIYENVNRLMDASVFGVAVYNSEEREIEYKYFREKEREVESWKKSVDANDSFAGLLYKGKIQEFLSTT